MPPRAVTNRLAHRVGNYADIAENILKGHVGDTAAFSERSLTPSDVLDELPIILKELEDHEMDRQPRSSG